MNGCSDLIRIVVSIIIPPLGVFLRVGVGLAFWVNIVLTLLGYVPGLVHAIWIVATYDRDKRRCAMSCLQCLRPSSPADRAAPLSPSKPRLIASEPLLPQG